MDISCLKIPVAYKELDYRTNPELAERLIEEVDGYCELATGFVLAFRDILETTNSHLQYPERIFFNTFLLAKRMLYYHPQEWNKQILVSIPTILSNFEKGCKTVADCKTYALFCYCVLQGLGFNPKIVFASYKTKNIKNHVFVTCNNVIIDATVNYFNNTPKAKFYHVWQKQL